MATYVSVCMPELMVIIIVPSISTTISSIITLKSFYVSSSIFGNLSLPLGLYHLWPFGKVEELYQFVSNNYTSSSVWCKL